MLIPLFTWSAIHAVIAAIILVVSIVGGSLFWIFKHIHDRLTTLEDGRSESSSAIFGNDENPLNDGLTKEVAELKQEIEEITREIDDSSVERDDLKQRIVEVEQKIERILGQLEDND